MFPKPVSEHGAENELLMLKMKRTQRTQGFEYKAHQSSLGGLVGLKTRPEPEIGSTAPVSQRNITRRHFTQSTSVTHLNTATGCRGLARGEKVSPGEAAAMNVRTGGGLYVCLFSVLTGWFFPTREPCRVSYRSSANFAGKYVE